MAKTKKVKDVVKDRNSIKLTLKEMFVIFGLSKKVEFLSHRIGLDKQVQIFTEYEKFCKLLDLKDIMEKNIVEINKKYKPPLDKIKKKLVPFNGKPMTEVPEDIKVEHSLIVSSLNGEIDNKNKEYAKEFDVLTEESNEYKVEIKDLARKAIIMFCEKDDLKVGDLGMTEPAIECLIGTYSKLT